MAIDRSMVGKTTDPLRHAYDVKDAILYALGVGATTALDLDYLYEARGPRVLPTFAVVPSFSALIDVVTRLRVDLMAVLHGEQTVIQHCPIPPRGEFRTVATVDAIYDKGKGALAVVTARTCDDHGEPMFDNIFSIFVRGEGGFGGERGPEALKADPPAGRVPDFEETQTTSPEQAALYRLCGDANPLHIDPSMARSAGFERPILHGLCTYGYAGRAIVRHACAGDPARFRSLAARFSGVVYPGDTLVTRGWRIAPDRFVLQVVKPDGTVVLTNAIAEVAA